MMVLLHMVEFAKYKKVILILIAAILITLFLWYEDNAVTVSRYNIKSSRLPQKFEGFKIVQISDFHNKVFTKNDKVLIEKIKAERPDIIVITGDLIDRRRYDEEKAMILIRGIKGIAPVYYAPGNHEALSGTYESLRKKLTQNGVILLENEAIHLKRKNNSISVIGIKDPAFSAKRNGESNKNYKIVQGEIEKIIKTNMTHQERDLSNYKILLSHRCELMDLYAKEDIDVIFTGHAHGGQINIPFIGGLIAPNQGFFPKYYKGTYKENNTVMVVSRGLGNSLAPFRIFNRPEIVSVTLSR